MFSGRHDWEAVVLWATKLLTGQSGRFSRAHRGFQRNVRRQVPTTIIQSVASTTGAYLALSAYELRMEACSRPPWWTCLTRGREKTRAATLPNPTEARPNRTSTARSHALSLADIRLHFGATEEAVARSVHWRAPGSAEPMADVLLRLTPLAPFGAFVVAALAGS